MIFLLKSKVYNQQWASFYSLPPIIVCKMCYARGKILSILSIFCRIFTPVYEIRKNISPLGSGALKTSKTTLSKCCFKTWRIDWLVDYFILAKILRGRRSTNCLINWHLMLSETKEFVCWLQIILKKKNEKCISAKHSIKYILTRQKHCLPNFKIQWNQW